MIKNNLSFILLALLFSAAASGFISNIYAQEEVVMDSLVNGNKYRITLYNDKEVIGKVVKQDSIYVYIVTETGTVRVRFEDIFSISKSTIPRLMKAMFTLGGGILLQGGNYNGYRDNNSPGFSIQATGLFPFSENKAIRLDLSYGRLKRDNYYYTVYYDPIGGETTQQQNIHVYNAYAQFLFGDFNTKSNFSVYGLAGLGIMHINEEGYSYTTYNSYDSTYYHYTNPEYNYTNFSIAIGGGLRFRINNRLGAFAEAQYNMTTYEGFFFFFGKGYFPIRAGLTYTFY